MNAGIIAMLEHRLCANQMYMFGREAYYAQLECTYSLCSELLQPQSAVQIFL